MLTWAIVGAGTLVLVLAIVLYGRAQLGRGKAEVAGEKAASEQRLQREAERELDAPRRVGSGLVDRLRRRPR